jgi:ABC-type lipoprotein export system ATPase subunit
MLELDNIHHRIGDRTIVQLESFALAPGEACLLLGPSGSGKSTALAIAAGLLRPTRGRVTIDGTELAQLSGTALNRFRGQRIGMVFQGLHLIASLTVRQNLAAAQFCARRPQSRVDVDTLLDTLGLRDRADALPVTLSGGEAQRVAIARAVINRPRLLLADEPTASLDDANASSVLDLLLTQARECDAALLIATHDARAVARITRRIALAG